MCFGFDMSVFTQQFQHGGGSIQFAVGLHLVVAHPGAAVVRLHRPAFAHMDEFGDDPLGFHLASKARRAGTLLDFIPCSSPSTVCLRPRAPREAIRADTTSRDPRSWAEIEGRGTSTISSAISSGTRGLEELVWRQLQTRREGA